MASPSHEPKFATVAINPQGQDLQHVHHIVEEMLKLGGCPRCGRAALLRVEFLSDPPPELAKQNVISITTQGL